MPIQGPVPLSQYVSINSQPHLDFLMCKTLPSISHPAVEPKQPQDQLAHNQQLS